MHENIKVPAAILLIIILLIQTSVQPLLLRESQREHGSLLPFSGSCILNTIYRETMHLPAIPESLGSVGYTYADDVTETVDHGSIDLLLLLTLQMCLSFMFM